MVRQLSWQSSGLKSHVSVVRIHPAPRLKLVINRKTFGFFIYCEIAQWQSTYIKLTCLKLIAAIHTNSLLSSWSVRFDSPSRNILILLKTEMRCKSLGCHTLPLVFVLRKQTHDVWCNRPLTPRVQGCEGLVFNMVTHALMQKKSRVFRVG